jgi:antitoxin component YwqK of YwqJK toxin-antitoxin module
MRTIILFVLVFLFKTFSFSQEATETRSMSAKDNNIAQNFMVYTEAILIKPVNDLIYFHYHDDKVYQTQGGYSGWLLHGKYESFFSDKVLHSQGEFRFGLKQGEWKQWHPNGMLKSVENWSRGYKSGDFAEYNEKGKMTKSGKYKRNILSGKIITYGDSGAVAQVAEYKNGKPFSKSANTQKVTIDTKKAQ